MTYYVILPKVAQTVTWQVFIASIACGLIIDTLLVVNNYRDRTNDKQANKYTLVVRIGEKDRNSISLVGYNGCMPYGNSLYFYQWNYEYS